LFTAGSKSVIFGRERLIVALKSPEFHIKYKIISRFSDRQPNRADYPDKLTLVALFAPKTFKNPEFDGNFIPDFRVKRSFWAKNELVN